MEQNILVSKEGWCKKLGAIIKTLRRRWYVLTQESLSYYKGPGGKVLGSIDFMQARIYEDKEFKKQPCFAIECPERTYHIITDTPKETEEWVQAMTDLQKLKQKPSVSLSDFEILKVIGRGAYGKVQLVKYIPTGVVYAMKSLSKRKLGQYDLVGRTVTEKNVLVKANHPNIVSARFTFQSDTKLFLVLDYIQGGELFSRLREEEKFSEKRTKLYAAQLVLAIQYLHSINVVHRDLKPENILLDKNGYLKITDFGLVKESMNQTTTTSTFCGTPEYIAPEMIEGKKYNYSVDWWSIGILIYEMLFGAPPFYDTNTNILYQMIATCKVQFPTDAPRDAVDIITKLLDKNPSTRLGSGPTGDQEIIEHPFFKDIPWQDLLEQTIPMEYIPPIKNITDVSQFDDCFTREPAVISYEDPSLVSSETNRILDGFTCTNEASVI